MKKYIHYRHRNKQWIYWISDKKEDFYFVFPYMLEKEKLIESKDIKTEKEIKKYLKEKFPEYELVKPRPYHSSPGPVGSRPKKKLISWKEDRKHERTKRKLIENNFV